MKNVIPTIEKRVNQRAKAFQLYNVHKMYLIRECRAWITLCYGKPDNLVNAIVKTELLPRLQSMTPHTESKHHQSWMLFLAELQSKSLIPDSCGTKEASGAMPEANFKHASL
jgi:hypothetical protein